VRIEIRNVTVDFAKLGHHALDDVDLTIDEGERVALLGPSGAGKTTLLRFLLGAVTPTTGNASVGGLNPLGPGSEVTRLRRRTACIRQRDDLVPGLTARTNALMATSPCWTIRGWFSLLRGRVPHPYGEALTSLASRYGIESRLASRVENLSGGQRQRVALVRALLTCPDLLLADEPTSGLDPRNADLVVDGMLDAPSRTVVLATHDLGLARRLPRVVALREGRVVYDGPAPEEAVLNRIYGPAKESVRA
jgi:ABC-type phosphate/phosphonate transport system ATPase subunit